MARYGAGLRLFATSCVTAAAALIATEAETHPHVWIRVDCAFVFDDRRQPVGFIATWVFDEMYSAFAVVGAPRDRNGQSTSAGLSSLAGVIVAASKDQGHFTIATVGGRQVALSEPKDVEGAWGENQKLSVRFRMDFQEPVRTGGPPLRIEVHDADLYADFQFNAALPSAGLPPNCSVRLDDGQGALPSDPQAVEQALINGPLLTLASGIELTCR